MSRAQLICGVFLAFSIAGSTCADTGERPGAAVTPKALGTQTAPTNSVADTPDSLQEKKTDITGAVSKAYMNCLIEVDRSMAELMRHANAKAVRAESKSQRAFCENRKRECKETPDSPGCVTFLEEFNQIDPLTGE